MPQSHRCAHGRLFFSDEDSSKDGQNVSSNPAFCMDDRRVRMLVGTVSTGDSTG